MVKTKPSAPNVAMLGKKIKALFSGEKVTSNSAEAVNLYAKSNFGEMIEDKVSYSLVEAFYLVQKGKMDVLKSGKKMSLDAFAKELSKGDKGFMTRYRVFSDLRGKGYLVKTALKFGADFRVYDKGAKMGEQHARWIVFPVHESAGLTWHEFAAKNRVAHSTKKNLLIAIVDDEGDVTYYEAKWLRP